MEFILIIAVLIVLVAFIKNAEDVTKKEVAAGIKNLTVWTAVVGGKGIKDAVAVTYNTSSAVILDLETSQHDTIVDIANKNADIKKEGGIKHVATRSYNSFAKDFGVKELVDSAKEYKSNAEKGKEEFIAKMNEIQAGR